jgi:hypothetical protein
MDCIVLSDDESDELNDLELLDAAEQFDQVEK